MGEARAGECGAFYLAERHRTLGRLGCLSIGPRHGHGVGGYCEENHDG